MTNNVAKLEVPKMLEDQKKNKRLVILALEDDFNEQEKAYRPGKSDKTVADELGVSPGFVCTVREEFYGKLAEPDEIGSLRADLAIVRKLADDIEGKLTGLCNRNGWRV